MGCSVPSSFRSTMSFLGGKAGSEIDIKTKLERKLYIAKETPEPIFDLSDCELKEVPSGTYSICKVYRKEQLLLNNNCLKKLDDGGMLSDLYLLKILNLSSNKFSNIDDSLRFLVNLKELYLQNNNLSHLPDSIGDLKNLQILDLSHNQLRRLPPAIGGLKYLRQLLIIKNPNLSSLCPELCGASNIISIELDCPQFTNPPADITMEGTVPIMKFLSDQMNVEYVPPINDSEQIAVNTHSSISHENLFKKQHSFSWEEQEVAMALQESKMHEASQLQKQEILSKIMQDQTALDTEIVKIQNEKEQARHKLIKDIQDDELWIASIVDGFIHSNNQNPDILQQELEYEQREHDRLLEICRENYSNIRKTDILKAMETILNEECAFQSTLQNYEATSGDMKSSMLLQELESSEKLEQVFKLQDETRSSLVTQLLEDQDVQKAVVASLLERVDTRTWSLNQEIAIVTSNLAKLSLIEQEKQKLKINYNYNQLLDQREHLLALLADLFSQQNKRREQLIHTLKEMESETNNTTDFWLANYQRLLDSAPTNLREMGKSLDPLFANCLLKEGVIHCLPFLVKLIFSSKSLSNITTEDLRENGVNLSSDRESILKAIDEYIEIKTKGKLEMPCPSNSVEIGIEVCPTAPPLPALPAGESISGVMEASSADSGLEASECVVCMDSKCEVVFIPCGHLCCCSNCVDKEINSCPMCRNNIERKIKVIIP